MGRWFRSYGVGYEEILDFVDSNECVAGWLRKFRLAPRGESVWLSAREKLSGSRLNKARILCRFFRWLRVKKEIFLSPSEVLQRHRDLRLGKASTPSERKWLLNLVFEHSRDNPVFADYCDDRKYGIFNTIKSFVDYHEVPLTSAKNVYGKKRRKKKFYRKQITPVEAKKLLGQMSQRDRTICLIMWQSGMEIGAVLNKFSYLWFSQVKPQLDAGCQRMKIEFEERKYNGQPYFTFISRDGIHELRKWLQERERIIESVLADGNEVKKQIIEGEPIFITSKTTPLRRALFVSEFSRRWDGKATSHMFRKLFKSEAGVPDRGISHRIVKFFMGHITDLDDMGGVYDRNPEIREEIYEKEYAKLEPYINIYSSPIAPERTDPLLADIQNVMREEGGREFFERLLKKMDEETSDWLKKGRADP